MTDTDSEAKTDLNESAVSRPVSTPEEKGFILVSPQAASATRKIELHLGEQIDQANSPLTVSPENLFGRHCVVVGSTGSGKSWTLAKIIEEVSKYNSRVILIDASGEFNGMDGEAVHLCVGAKTPEDGKDVSVPYYHLRECDIFAIFKPTGPSQAPKLRAAIQSLKLAQRVSNLAPDGTIQKAHKSRVDFDHARESYASEIEGPFCDFVIRNLPTQIQHECVDPQRSAVEPLVWGGPNGLELSHCVSLVNRIQDMISSPNLASVFQPGSQPSLFAEVANFIKQEDKKVLRISVKHLPFEYDTREIIGNAIGRYLLELGRVGAFKDKPMLICLDEAHQFLAATLRDNNEHFPLDSFGLIAKEGRKYALTTCLSTQRVCDIPEDILSQVGTMVVHRLTNGNDLEVVERACGFIGKEAMEKVPMLAPGEAILVGVNFNKPMLVKIAAPKKQPDSHGPDYQRFWN